MLPSNRHADRILILVELRAPPLANRPRHVELTQLSRSHWWHDRCVHLIRHAVQFIGLLLVAQT
jgi:hypothetical protein